jgi:DNA-binding transcriptional LysR family regulator
MDSLVSMRVFCLVAELKSFAAAAERLRISPAMASKHVMQL